jgi:hypothetical protein
MNNFIMAVVLLSVAASYYFISPVFVTVAQDAAPAPGIQNFSDDETSFNLWWLVPLLLIPPILYFLARAGEEADGYDDEEREFMPGLKTSKTSSGFEKNAANRRAYFSEIKRDKKAKTSKRSQKTHKSKKA